MLPDELTDEQKQALRAIIDQRFDRLRDQLGLATDAELADHYKVYPKYISQWRNLRMSPLDLVFACMLLTEEVTEALLTP